MGSSWHPTAALVRSSVTGVVLAAIAVLLRRPDVMVIGAPLVVITLWSVWLRPSRPLEVTEHLAHRSLREGESTTWRVQLAEPAALPGEPAGAGEGAEDAVAVFGRPPWSTLEPAAGVVCGALDHGQATLQVVLRSIRWGRREVGPAFVVATSAWGAFRWTAPTRPGHLQATLPLPSVFDSSAPAVHPVGLVGQHRSARRGDGSEFSSLRPFQSGDRLRRIHWPRSLRTGTLHVTSTWADQDSLVVLVVDAWNDLGPSDGIDGPASSLDVTVRAAGAIAEHHLRQGDRVELDVIGARGVSRVPPAAGPGHLRRVLDALSTIAPGSDLRDPRWLQLGLPAGALVVMLSPLASPSALQRAYTLAARGLTVVVIDTMPPAIVTEDAADPVHELAWRIRLLERDREIRRIQQIGVPVVAWRGPGSLDQVLRDLHRQRGKPRLVSR